jgi:calcineurin-like phosphoesterase family protein
MRKMYVIVCCLFVLLVSGCSSYHADAETVLTSRQNAKKLIVEKREEAFSFIIFADRTGGKPAGLEVLRKAVLEANLLDPDFIFTVGDLIEGANDRERWIRQMKEYRLIMDKLKMSWLPVAGNHDTRWKSSDRPEGGHRDDFEEHFGPVWYAYKHKNCRFIGLYTYEGHPVTGDRDFTNPENHKMSDEQKAWLKSILDKAKGDDHVFLFMHHPRWTKGKYGDDWDNVHKMLKEAGNVSAVIAGHTHTLEYGGIRDGIAYHTLGTTGANIKEENLQKGAEHHVGLVTVRGQKFSLSILPVGKIINPADQQFSHEPLLAKTWQFRSGAKRSVEYKVQIQKTPDSRQWLTVAIGHASDDSGDFGMHYRLIDPKGKTIDRKFLWHEGIDTFEYRIEQSGQYTIKLQDKDTKFGGRRPGNEGTIEVKHKKVIQPKKL